MAPPRFKIPFTRLEAGLADNWRSLKSRGTVIFAAIMSLAQLVGPQLQSMWLGMPDEIKSVLPSSWQTAIKYAILFGMFAAIRYTTIRKVDPPSKE